MGSFRRLSLPLVFVLCAVDAHADEGRAHDVDPTAIRAAVAAWTTPPPGGGAAATAPASRSGRRLERRRMNRGWGFDGRLAALRQFETDIDGGGRMTVDRLFAQANVSYSPKPGMPFTVSFGYRFDGYDFDGQATGAFPGRPWADVHTFSVAVPLFVPVSERWFVLAIPVIRTTVEQGAAWDDGITGGGIVGASYKISDRLRIGPGLGVFTQLEDDPTIFPVLLVDWSITPRLALKTGRGLGATQGPGVFLEYQPSECLLFALGGRYDKLRFRLDDEGSAPRGIGEESAWAVVLGARWQATRRIELNLSVGMSFRGELRLEDRDGNRLVREDHDPAPFVGLGFSLRL